MRNETTSNNVWRSSLALGLLIVLQSGCTSGLTPNMGAASWLKPPTLAMPWNTAKKESSVAASKSNDTIGSNTDSLAKESAPSKSASSAEVAKAASTPPAKQGGFSFSEAAPAPSPTRPVSDNRVMPASLTSEVGATKCDTCGEGKCACGEDHGPRPAFKFGSSMD
jgi:hypothetical protein